ncbi:SufE family protein [Salinarimonas chemoclinalis]|uniref:SufE family protein n=1 Tax=Salinarimonas chemoclinalis TaxID=3241599 RepID=UPI003556F5A6
MLPKFDEIVANLEFLDDWEERYRYVIELGRLMPELPEDAHTEANRVHGCASQVWLETVREDGGAGDPVLVFRGDSDAHIVRGLVALLVALYSGKPASEISTTDAVEIFDRLGLREHLTPQRSNGVRAMVERIRRDAIAATVG